MTESQTKSTLKKNVLGPKLDTQPRISEPSKNGNTPPPAAPHVSIDSAHVPSLYSNFARVTGSPEEMIVDFALNPHPFGGSEETIPISQRIVMNYYTAKRFLGALQMAVQRHEQAFGVLETDVNKRVVRVTGQAGG